jgi:hypothetical protein
MRVLPTRLIDTTDTTLIIPRPTTTTTGTILIPSRRSQYMAALRAAAREHSCAILSG